MICNHDCFHCVFDDCINDSVYSEKGLYRNRSEAAKEYQRAYAKRTRDEAAKKGFCIVCRKKAAAYGSKCYECYLRQKRLDRKKNTGKRESWKLSGLCYYCGGAVVPGKKVCERHYKVLQKNISACNSSDRTKQARKAFSAWAFGGKPEAAP